MEASIDTLISRCQELKQSIAAFIIKLETEYELMNWQSFLDNFALISGQINNMMKVIKSDRTPSYKNRIVLPLLLSPDHDEELFKLTEGRVPMFNHDMCPDYLRTKPIPEIEANEKKTADKMAKIAPESVNKLILSSNKIVNKLLDTIKSQRENWANDALQTHTPIGQTFTQQDTNAIIAALNGKGIIEPLEPAGPVTKGPATVPQTAAQPAAARGKVPAVRTTIKAAANR